MASKQINLFACELKGFLVDNRVDIPLDFYRHIVNTQFVARWTPPVVNGELELGVEHLNIKDFNQDTIADSDLVIFSGILIEANRDNRNLVDIHGNLVEAQLQESSTFPFVIVPQHNLVIIAEKEEATKLSRYLSMQIASYRNAQHNQQITFDNITIRPIPNEGTPTTVLRRQPNLGSFKARLNVSAFKQRYGLGGHLEGTILDGLTPQQEQNIIVNIEFTAGRGDELPEILSNNLIDLVETTHNHNDLISAYYRTTENRKKSPYTKLLNMLTSKAVVINYETINGYLISVNREIKYYILEVVDADLL